MPHLKQILLLLLLTLNLTANNIEGKQEIIKDKLERISLFVYDEAGNFVVHGFRQEDIIIIIF